MGRLNLYTSRQILLCRVEAEGDDGVEKPVDCLLTASSPQAPLRRHHPAPLHGIPVEVVHEIGTNIMLSEQA